MRYFKRSERILQKLPKDIRIRIFDKISNAKHDPFRFFERLQVSQGYKLRIGDYRVIADISVERRLIEIRLIAHRSRVYTLKSFS